jgi:hypothetical protein
LSARCIQLRPSGVRDVNGPCVQRATETSRNEGCAADSSHEKTRSVLVFWCEAQKARRAQCCATRKLKLEVETVCCAVMLPVRMPANGMRTRIVARHRLLRKPFIVT